MYYHLGELRNSNVVSLGGATKFERSVRLFKFSTAVQLKIQVFWEVTLFRLVSSFGRFELSRRFHLQGHAVKQHTA